MKKAFTMIEIIFTIVLIGIIYISSNSFIKKNTLVDDRNFFINKIRETKSNANNINLFQNNGGLWKNFIDNDEYNSVCINLNYKKDRFDNKIAQIDKDIKDLKYYMSEYTNINFNGINNLYNKVCFDNFGAPYSGDFNINNKLQNNIEIILSQGSQQFKITIMKDTGYLLF